MSRSWERKVRKNMSKINKDRKKSGTSEIVLNAEKFEMFTGRNIVSPILIILFVAAYSFISMGNEAFEATTMYWITLALYVGLAILFYFRKPYFKIGKDYVQSRRFTGDKRISATFIKSFRVQNGYVTVFPHKGAPWTFSRLMNRFPTDEMTKSVKVFAATHGIAFEEK